MKKAIELYESATVEVQGPLQYIHTFVDMSQVVVTPEFTGQKDSKTLSPLFLHNCLLTSSLLSLTDIKTCLGALGDSFAGGTTDGPGDFNFRQGVNDSSTNAYWNFLAHFLSEPTEEQTKCQYPKVLSLNY